MEGSAQHPFMAGKVRVLFPFEPYPIQREYMENVIEALDKNQNATLESPTGTGKTLSLLCSSMAWLDGKKSVKIYYTSRTHQQLAQAAKELKRTAYAKKPSVVLGSRVQMCINSEVRNQQSDVLINRGCHAAIANRSCSYYKDYDKKMKSMDLNKVLDIEELRKFGNEHQCCPYYMSRKIAESKSNLVFLPYNYLFDIFIMKNMQLKIDNSVIIVDEAHNIENVLKDAASGEFSYESLHQIKECCEKLPNVVTKAMDKLRSRYRTDGPSSIVDDLSETNDKPDHKENSLVHVLEELAQQLTSENLQRVRRCCLLLLEENYEAEFDSTFPIEKLFSLMKKAEIEYLSSDFISITLESAKAFLSKAEVSLPNSAVARYVASITSFHQFISLLFPDCCLNQLENEKSLSDSYVFHLASRRKESDRFKEGIVIGWDFKLWCLNPAVGLKRILSLGSEAINVKDPSRVGLRSLILTSGTLTPMQNLGKELDMEFKISNSFDHVIKLDQFKIAIIERSPDYFPLNSLYKDQTDKYFAELGKTLLPLFKILPHGTLVFFPSYQTMKRIFYFWENKSRIMQDMKKTTHIFIEKQGQEQNEFDSDFRKFKSKSQGRAVYFVVCRGKLSEGANLKDNECRTVILTGYPFACVTDPKVLATKQFYRKKAPNAAGLWYSQQMHRAVNQTIGRVIRSKDDFGLLLLISPKFIEYRCSLPKWVKSFFPNQYLPFNEAEMSIKNFFSSKGITVGQSATNVSFSKPKTAVAKPRLSNGNSSLVAQEKQRKLWNSYRSEGSVSPTNVILTSSSDSNGRPQPDNSERMLNQIDLNQIEVDTEQIHPPIDPPPNQTGGSSQEQVETPKSLNIFLRRKRKQVPALKSNKQLIQPEASTSQSATVSQNSRDYSIYDQFRDERRPACYKCYICKRAAEDPRSINCPCARVGCASCLRVLHKVECGQCKTLLNRRNFRKLLFKSACFSGERVPPITLHRKGAK